MQATFETELQSWKKGNKSVEQERTLDNVQ